MHRITTSSATRHWPALAHAAMSAEYVYVSAFTPLALICSIADTARLHFPHFPYAVISALSTHNTYPTTLQQSVGMSSPAGNRRVVVRATPQSSPVGEGAGIQSISRHVLVHVLCVSPELYTAQDRNYLSTVGVFRTLGAETWTV